MSWLASFYPHHDVWCERCHEWSDPADWDEVDDETIACPNCEAENGPLDGPALLPQEGPGDGMTPDLTTERIELFVRHQLPQRPLTVQISPALERRLVAFGEAFNDEVPDDPMNLSHDSDLGVLLLACAERGLRDDEDERGQFADFITGHLFTLPRPVRAPVWLRARIVLEYAITKWRAL